MILINLLPHREAARKRRRETFYATLGASAVAGCLIAGGAFLWYQAQISSQQGKNSFLQAEIKKLEAEIKEISTLQAEIAALRARQQAVEDLQGDRNMPVHLLNELVRQLPDGVYLTSMKQDNQTVTLHGHGAVQRAGVGAAAQPGQQQPLAGQAGADRNHFRQCQPERARPASRGELHDAHRPQAAHGCAEGRDRRRRGGIGRRQRLSVIMATQRASSNIDIGAALQRFGDQFRGLNPNDPSVWPPVPRYALCVVVTALVLVALWFVWLTNSNDELEAERAKEVALRADYQKKVAQAANLELLKKQREQVQQYVTLLEKQLPSKAEMDALLSDINQAGLGRSLQFELFRPGQIIVKDYYAELPIAVRVTGRYHDMGAFAADVANLSRIVTLNNLAVDAR